MSKGIEKNFSGLNCMMLDEPKINTEASEYIVDNMAAISCQAHKMVGVDPNKVDDLVQDVFKSILESEREGNGFNMNHGDNGSMMTVAEFVYGRLKRYSKNRKYSVGGDQCHMTTKHVNGQKISTIDVTVQSASSNGENLDDMSGIQKAYANASSYDDIDSVDTKLSLRSDIDFCCSFNEVVGFDFMNLFKNINLLTSVKLEDGLFDGLHKAIKVHDELNSALHNVMDAYINNHTVYEEALASC